MASNGSSLESPGKGGGGGRHGNSNIIFKIQHKPSESSRVNPGIYKDFLVFFFSSFLPSFLFPPFFFPSFPSFFCSHLSGLTLALKLPSSRTWPSNSTPPSMFPHFRNENDKHTYPMEIFARIQWDKAALLWAHACTVNSTQECLLDYCDDEGES